MVQNQSNLLSVEFPSAILVAKSGALPIRAWSRADGREVPLPALQIPSHRATPPGGGGHQRATVGPGPLTTSQGALYKGAPDPFGRTKHSDNFSRLLTTSRERHLSAGGRKVFGNPLVTPPVSQCQVPCWRCFLRDLQNCHFGGRIPRFFPNTHNSMTPGRAGVNAGQPSPEGWGPPGHRHPQGRGEEVCPDVPRLVGAPGGSRGPRGRGWNPRRSVGVGGEHPGVMVWHIPETDRIGGIGRVVWGTLCGSPSLIDGCSPSRSVFRVVRQEPASASVSLASRVACERRAEPRGRGCRRRSRCPGARGHGGTPPYHSHPFAAERKHAHES